MPSFRYQMHGSWYKGNTHVHSRASDGGKNFNELAQLYAAAGYHFLFRTDHWVASDARADTQDYPLLFLDGVELDGYDQTGAGFHVVALGAFTGLRRDMGLEKALESAREQGGFLVLAHPRWMGNTFEDALRLNFDAVEVHNHICHWLNGKGDGAAYWSAMLDRRPNTLAIASDDAHLNADEPGCNGGWIVVSAPECSPGAIYQALRAGNYYSSTGPEIYNIAYDGEQVSVECSPAQYVRLVGPAYRGVRALPEEGEYLTSAAFKIQKSWAYAYLEVEDAQGRIAWSNPLFVSEGSDQLPAAQEE